TVSKSGPRGGYMILPGVDVHSERSLFCDSDQLFNRLSRIDSKSGVNKKGKCNIDGLHSIAQAHRHVEVYILSYKDYGRIASTTHSTLLKYNSISTHNIERGTSNEILPRQDRANSVEFMSNKYDELYSFKKEANKQIQDLTAKVNKISEKCERIAKFIEESEAYSYQYNIKIVGVPAVAERETAQQTADLCIKLFTALGVEDVSISDIDTAHRVPSRLASSTPKAIICKFVRRLAKDKVMAARRAVGNLNAEQLQLESSANI
ncbi:Hypothetical predicted protein, partial [Paramuricea clavata]